MKNQWLTPTEVQAIRIADLQAQLELADERIYFLVAEVARLNAELGCTEFRTANFAHE